MVERERNRYFEVDGAVEVDWKTISFKEEEKKKES